MNHAMTIASTENFRSFSIAKACKNKPFKLAFSASSFKVWRLLWLSRSCCSRENLANWIWYTGFFFSCRDCELNRKQQMMTHKLRFINKNTLELSESGKLCDLSLTYWILRCGLPPRPAVRALPTNPVQGVVCKSSCPDFSEGLVPSTDSPPKQIPRQQLIAWVEERVHSWKNW